ncbi:hypothetical protein [Corynebacterium provencense]|uniref:hypothetical protein n=1 Tax=Corynebacterium provencense TaxID=1737425 RepID=UPI0011CC0EC4|nr:hypothetical protein [Corynebacterium provencense]
MSLINRVGSSHTVTVVLREMRDGDRARQVPVETGRVTVYGRLQESSSEDITAAAAAGEIGVMTVKNFICPRFPGDDLSQVIDGDGVLYNVVGEPKRHRGSRATARDVVRLREAGVVRGGRDG